MALLEHVVSSAAVLLGTVHAEQPLFGRLRNSFRWKARVLVALAAPGAISPTANSRIAAFNLLIVGQFEVHAGLYLVRTGPHPRARAVRLRIASARLAEARHAGNRAEAVADAPDLDTVTCVLSHRCLFRELAFDHQPLYL